MNIELKDRMKVDPVTGCWNWVGATSHFGYGKICHKGRYLAAHRVAAHLWMGFDLKDSRCVLHRCDNPPCINPDHLFLGTKKDNTRDCVNKGRFRGGIRKSERTSCKNGHPFISESMYLRSDASGRRHRRCRICERESAIKYYWSKKGNASTRI